MSHLSLTGTESCVKYIRLNYLVPVPEVRSLEDLNERLKQNCHDDLKRRLRGKTNIKEEMLKEDKFSFLPLPAVPFDASHKATTRANSLSLVRYKSNDYSVPTSYAHHQINIKGYMDRVELCCQDKRIAVHKRLWTKESVSFDPVHYLEVLENKPGALDYTRPLEEWQLPECFADLRRRLETDYMNKGTREYIKVLRLLEDHSLSKLRKAVEKGLRTRAYSRDAIAQDLHPQEPWAETTFCLEGHEHLRYVKVDSPRIEAYVQLL